MRALACFHNPGRFGFRHCFVVVQTEDDWVALDADQDLGVLIEAICGAEYDLAAHYRKQGFTVLEVTRRRRPFNPIWPVMITTCVGAAKKLLGIRKPWILTPQQLYRYLEEA